MNKSLHRLRRTRHVLQRNENILPSRSDRKQNRGWPMFRSSPVSKKEKTKERVQHLTQPLFIFSNSRAIYGGAVETLDPYHPHYIGLFNLQLRKKGISPFLHNFILLLFSADDNPQFLTNFSLKKVKIPAVCLFFWLFLVPFHPS